MMPVLIGLDCEMEGDDETPAINSHTFLGLK
jgi:hypothetical protein